MVDFQLDEMQEMLRELAHEFAVDEIRPHAEHWDEESVYPKEVIQMAHEMGLLNLHIPEKYGGPGLGCMEEVLVNEELAWGDPGFATAAYATALACAPIITGATEAQKDIWLRKVAEEGALASYAITEPGAGSDVAAIKTTAVRDGDEYVIGMEMNMLSMAQRCGLLEQDMLTFSSFLPRLILMLATKACLVSLSNRIEKAFRLERKKPTWVNDAVIHVVYLSIMYVFLRINSLVKANQVDG